MSTVGAAAAAPAADAAATADGAIDQSCKPVDWALNSERPVGSVGTGSKWPYALGAPLAPSVVVAALMVAAEGNRLGCSNSDAPSANGKGSDPSCKL